MRYLVTAKLKKGSEANLLKQIEDGTLGRGSVAGDEYLHNMSEARIGEDGKAQWVETCFCSEPLAEERAYWEEFFELLSVQDAHSRRSCRDLNGTEPWACCNCDCTAGLETQLKNKGKSFLHILKSSLRKIEAN